MTVNAALSISSLIDVTASLSAAALQAQSTQTMLILGNSPVIDTTVRLRPYASSTAVATDFGDSAPETAAAVIWYSQSPQPAENSLYIGRWAQTATSGQLNGGPLTAAQQLLSNWTAITDGGFQIALNGAAAESLTGLNFADVTNLNAVAGIIQAALTGATITYDSTYENFVVVSNTTGATSSVGFAIAPTAAGVTDISAMLGLTVGTSGCYTAQGVAAETALAAASLFDEQFGELFYGMSILGAANADHLVVAPFLAASSNKHHYIVSTQEGGVLVSATTTDIAAQLSALNVARTSVQYNSSSPYSAISLAARMLSVDYTGSNTTITAMYQQEPGIQADSINSTQLAAMLAKNCNGYLNYNNGASIIQPGICSDGQYIDTVIGADALTLAIQSAVFNLLYTSTTKIPQTDAGMNIIKTTIEQVLAQFAANGYIAPGVWDAAGFGAISEGQTLTTGYYVYAPPISSQSVAQRAKRISVPFQVAAKLAGAVQTVNVAITLNS